MIRNFVAVLLALALTACGGSSPGPLAGTWQSAGPVPMKTTFRSGETESMGLIEKVDYKADGNSVIVTYKDGLMKGSSMRVQMVNATTIRAMDMTFSKVGN
jgi:hypothetical protein